MKFKIARYKNSIKQYNKKTRVAWNSDFRDSSACSFNSAELIESQIASNQKI
ncbi:hypothetical protein [Arachidicoccus sp.]|uniref:hypothetical protein n=1 Tax=Arachidicoccus sp. TaxID=1872624 RepID=UPI003D22CA45